MGKFIVNGGRKLSGSLTLESAKNSVLPMIAGAVLTDEDVVIKSCPKISDVMNMLVIVRSLGGVAYFNGEDLIINCAGVSRCDIPYETTKELRASFLMLGTLLARYKKVKIAYPGGCEIGIRPIDIHISALRTLGAIIDESDGELNCTTNGLNGKDVYFDFPSVGATENVMIASTLANGTTKIHNPAKEPEIIDLANMLNLMGAKIHGAGSNVITIEGVKKLHGAEYKPIPDRIEAGTYLIAAAITGGEIELNNVKPENISSLIVKLCDNTCKIRLKNDIIYLKSGDIRKSFQISTGPYPFFPTDMQAQVTSLLSVSQGISVVEENVFEMRFRHVPELVKMGADIKVRGKTSIIKGVRRLYGTSVTAHDLRCAAALMLAGLTAEGKTIIDGSKHLERGYYNMPEKLTALGADVYKIE